MDYVYVDNDSLVECIKMSVALELSFYEDELLYLDVPIREDFESLEEYERAEVQFMNRKIDEIKNIKHVYFSSILDSYNMLLDEVLKVKNQDIYDRAALNDLIELNKKDMKATGITFLSLAVLFPDFIPLNALINLPRIVLDILQNKNYLNTLEQIDKEKETLFSFRDKFYEFVCTLRSDYHKSNKELDSLRERANNGENIIPELLDIISPKRIGFTEDEAECCDELLGEDNYKLVKKIK